MDSNVSKEYKISEIVDTTGVSKATIYNKLGTLKDLLRNHIKIRKGIRYVDHEGFCILKDSIGFSKEQYTDLKEKIQTEPKIVDTEGVSTKIETLEKTDKYIESLETQIEYLKKVIAEKDRQLDTKDVQIAEITKLVENSQVLQKQQQEKIFFLEDSTTQQKRSFWDRFRRGDN